jgi:hypothetical protein
MDPADSPPRRRWWLRIFLTLLAALLLYALSIGPVLACFLCRAIREPDLDVAYERLQQVNCVVAFYDPVLSVTDNTGLTGHSYAYIYWWIELVFRLTGTNLDGAENIFVVLQIAEVGRELRRQGGESTYDQ